MIFNRTTYDVFLTAYWRSLLVLGLLLSPWLSLNGIGEEPPLQTIVFQPSTEDFVNPERGFFHFRDLTNTFGYNTVRSQGHSLIYGRILASNFRNGPLSQSFLSQIQAGFDAARANGIKVKPRVVYNDDGGADAPKSVILVPRQNLWVAKWLLGVYDRRFRGISGQKEGFRNLAPKKRP